MPGSRSGRTTFRCSTSRPERSSREGCGRRPRSVAGDGERAARRALPIFAPLGALVVDGELEVSTGRVLHRGDSFGEIALLRDVPRTATVRALTAVRLDALDKEAFLASVTGHPGSRRAADAVVQALLH